MKFLPNFLTQYVLTTEGATFESPRKAHILWTLKLQIANCEKNVNKKAIKNNQNYQTNKKNMRDNWMFNLVSLNKINLLLQF